MDSLSSIIFCHLGYERVYLPLHKVADTPSLYPRGRFMPCITPLLGYLIIGLQVGLKSDTFTLTLFSESRQLHPL